MKQTIVLISLAVATAQISYAENRLSGQAQWSCSAMCGQSNNYRYVYGSGVDANTAFRAIDSACAAPANLFVDWQETSDGNGHYTPATLQNACVGKCSMTDMGPAL